MDEVPEDCTHGNGGSSQRSNKEFCTSYQYEIGRSLEIGIVGHVGWKTVESFWVINVKPE